MPLSSVWLVISDDKGKSKGKSTTRGVRRRTPRVVDFPLDLPLSSDITNHTEDSGISGSGSRSCPQSGEVK